MRVLILITNQKSHTRKASPRIGSDQLGRTGQLSVDDNGHVAHTAYSGRCWPPLIRISIVKITLPRLSVLSLSQSKLRRGVCSSGLLLV